MDESAGTGPDGVKLRRGLARDACHQKIAMPCGIGLAHEVLDIEATTRAFGMLANEMKDFHGNMIAFFALSCKP